MINSGSRTQQKDFTSNWSIVVNYQMMQHVGNEFWNHDYVHVLSNLPVQHAFHGMKIN